MSIQPDLLSYDRFIVFFSGGKDSAVCLLTLLEHGVNPAQIELWHHDVDGRSNEGLMDWPCTPEYCKAVAAAWVMPIYFSWREGGFEREMLRDQAATAATSFEVPGGGVLTRGGSGPAGTRQRFPQVSPNLSVRWCSSSLKIDVADIALRNQPRFHHAHTLVLSGERAQESAARAHYKTFEPHRSDTRNGKNRRLIDVWRPVHTWTEQEVWACLQRHGLVPHVAYYLGWSRLSCMACIFGNADQWASVRAVSPERFSKIADYEQGFGCTIDRTRNVRDKAAQGTPYPGLTNQELIAQALNSTTYTAPVRISPSKWELPGGAYGSSGGPT